MYRLKIRLCDKTVSYKEQMKPLKDIQAQKEIMTGEKMMMTKPKTESLQLMKHRQRECHSMHR